MATFNELMQRFVDMSYDKLLSTANQAFADLSAHFEDFFDRDPDSSARALLLLTATCLGADNTLSKLEYRFINDLLNADHSYEDLLSMVKGVNGDEAVGMIDKLTDTLEGDARASLLALALCILAVDETISRDEVAFIKKLMA